MDTAASNTSHASNNNSFEQSYNFNFSFKTKENIMNNNNNTNKQNEPQQNRLNNNNHYLSDNNRNTRNKVNKRKKKSKLRIFGSRVSQKAFLFIIFFESLCRSIEFISIPFIKNVDDDDKSRNCSMNIVDINSISGINGIWYMYIETIASLLFPIAFSALAYQLCKIYYKFNDKNPSNTQELIFKFLYGLISVNFVCFFGTFILLFCIQFNNHKNDSSLQIYMTILYGVMCIILAICYIRFAFPIYQIYRRIHIIIYHKNNKKKLKKKTEKSLSETSLVEQTQVINDCDNGTNNDDIHISQDRLILFNQNEDDDNNSYINEDDYYSEITNFKMSTPNDITGGVRGNQWYYAKFITSMKRIWIVALYCGLSFLIRAIILMIPIITSWYEDKSYIHAIYFLFLEILPIFAMLYIYSNATSVIQ